MPDSGKFKHHNPLYVKKLFSLIRQHAPAQMPVLGAHIFSGKHFSNVVISALNGILYSNQELNKNNLTGKENGQWIDMKICSTRLF
ncbi:MAG: hypothetical protein LUH82_04280 [Clostridiales bacterium]|nr:hypothetical protein [Clostridiales bacterium]